MSPSETKIKIYVHKSTYCGDQDREAIHGTAALETIVGKGPKSLCKGK